MILSQYEPVKVVWDGTRIIPFAFESIGLRALEVWLETQTDVDTFDRVRLRNQDFNVVFTGIPPAYVGGTVTLGLGVVPDTVTRISIERNTPIQQLCDYSNFEPFHMDTIEFTLDRLTMIIQEVSARKCFLADYAIGDITQAIAFNAQEVLYGTVIDFALDKLVMYCSLMAANGEICSVSFDGLGGV